MFQSYFTLVTRNSLHEWFKARSHRFKNCMLPVNQVCLVNVLPITQLPQDPVMSWQSNIDYVSKERKCTYKQCKVPNINIIIYIISVQNCLQCYGSKGVHIEKHGSRHRGRPVCSGRVQILESSSRSPEYRFNNICMCIKYI